VSYDTALSDWLEHGVWKRIIGKNEEKMKQNAKGKDFDQLIINWFSTIDWIARSITKALKIEVDKNKPRNSLAKQHGTATAE
jgi:hypothetical protein